MNELAGGEVVRLRNLTHHNPLKKGEPGLLSVSFTAPKGTVFVAVLLGVEPKDGTNPLDPEVAMNMLGWMRKPEQNS